MHNFFYFCCKVTNFWFDFLFFFIFISKGVFSKVRKYCVEFLSVRAHKKGFKLFKWSWNNKYNLPWKTYFSYSETLNNEYIGRIYKMSSWQFFNEFYTTSIFKFGLSVCLSICLFVSNKSQNGWTDRAQIVCGTSRDPREGLWMIEILNICLHQNSMYTKRTCSQLI